MLSLNRSDGTLRVWVGLMEGSWASLGGLSILLCQSPVETAAVVPDGTVVQNIATVVSDESDFRLVSRAVDQGVPVLVVLPQMRPADVQQAAHGSLVETGLALSARYAAREALGNRIAHLYLSPTRHDPCVAECHDRQIGSGPRSRRAVRRL